MKTKNLLSLLLTLALVLVMLPAQTALAADPNKINLSNVSLSIGASGKLLPEITGEGTIFTFNNTNGEDIENHISNLSYSDSVQFYFMADIAQFLYHETGSNWNYGNQSGGIRLSFMDMQPYKTDPNYLIFSFTIRDRADGGKPSSFTLRIKKWEAQYTPEIKNTWFNTSMLIGHRISGSTWSTYNRLYASDFVPVKGQPHLFEYVLASSGTPPYYLDTEVTPHYKTTAYLDGSRFTGVEAAAGFTRRLAFTNSKTYYDFKIDPGTAFDEKHFTYAVTTWRLRIIPPAQAPTAAPTKSQFTYSLASKPYTGKAQALAVTPKTGAGKVTAILYNNKTTRPTNIGSYAVKVNVAAGTKYKAVTGLSLGTLKIVPSKTTISTAVPSTKQIKVSWKRVSASQKITAYEVRYRIKGSSAWITKACKASASSLTLKGLTRARTYEVQVRSYKTISGAKYYSAWSTSKISGKVK